MPVFEGREVRLEEWQAGTKQLWGMNSAKLAFAWSRNAIFLWKGRNAWSLDLTHRCASYMITDCILLRITTSYLPVPPLPSNSVLRRSRQVDISDEHNKLLLGVEGY
jgi:hypothetical protein